MSDIYIPLKIGVSIIVSFVVMLGGIYASYKTVGKDDLDFDEIDNPDPPTYSFGLWLNRQNLSFGILSILGIVFAFVIYFNLP